MLPDVMAESGPLSAEGVIFLRVHFNNLHRLASDLKRIVLPSEKFYNGIEAIPVRALKDSFGNYKDPIKDKSFLATTPTGLSDYFKLFRAVSI